MTEEDEGRRQLSRAEREILSRIDPGARAVVIATVMLVLVISSLLPWVGDATGWQVLVGRADPELDIGVLPWLFSLNSTIIGLGFGTLALVTRRWTIAWLVAVGSIVVTFEGVIAIWSRQTAPEHGPSFGLVLAVISMVVLTSQWLRVVWSRE